MKVANVARLQTPQFGKAICNVLSAARSTGAHTDPNSMAVVVEVLKPFASGLQEERSFLANSVTSSARARLGLLKPKKITDRIKAVVAAVKFFTGEIASLTAEDTVAEAMNSICKDLDKKSDGKNMINVADLAYIIKGDFTATLTSVDIHDGDTLAIIEEMAKILLTLRGLNFDTKITTLKKSLLILRLTEHFHDNFPILAKATTIGSKATKTTETTEEQEKMFSRLKEIVGLEAKRNHH